MELYKTCSIHTTKKAKRYCQQCNINICNECALTNHSSHIEKLIKIENLSSNNFKLLTDILNNKPTFTSCLSDIRCHSNSLHQGNYFCKSCNDFFCDSCIALHNNHSTFELNELYQHIQANIEIVLFIANTKNMWSILTIPNDVDKVNQIIKNIIDEKSLVEQTIQKKRNDYYEILHQFHKKISQKQGVITNNDLPNIDEIQKIYNEISIEKDNKSLVNLYLKFINFFNKIVSNDKENKELITDYLSIIKQKKLLTEENNLVWNQFIQLFNKLLSDLKAIGSKLTISPLKNEIQSKQPPEAFKKENPITNVPSSIQPITKIEEPNPFREMAKKSVQAKPMTVTKQEYNKSGSIHLNQIKKLAEISVSNNPDIDKDGVIRQSLKTFDEAKKIFDNGITPNIENIQPLASLTNVVQHSHAYSKSSLPMNNPKNSEPIVISSINNPENEVKKYVKTGTIHKIKQIYEKGQSNQITHPKKEEIKVNVQEKKVKIEEEKPTTPRFENNDEEEEIPKENFFSDNSTSQIHNQSDEGNDSLDGGELIKGINGEDIQDNTKNALPIEDMNIVSIHSNSNTISIFNSITKKITEMTINYTFYPNCAYINVIPDVYISGGKVDDIPQNTFIKLSKKDLGYEIITLPSITNPRSNHSMVYHKKDNCIYILTGSTCNACEKYNISTKSFTQLPNTKHQREKAIALIHNDTYLYLFFGFDKSVNKYCPTIERINISVSVSNEWEEIQPIGNSNFSKRKEIGYIMKDSSVILFGGSNSLREVTNNLLEYKFDTKEITVYHEMTLPISCAFSNAGFIQNENEFYNFDNVNQIIFFKTIGEKEEISIIS